MKFILISKNCYPVLGPRAHRTTELAKELARRGHTVILYTLAGKYNYDQFTKETGIVIKDLGKSNFGIIDNFGYRKKSFFIKIMKKVFDSLLEFPNIELLWKSYKALSKESEIDYLISIAHPHPIHWGVAFYKSMHPNKIKFWVADSGDPFMKDPFNYHPFYFKYFEKKWCSSCNYITVPLQEAKKGYYSEFESKIKVIPQGFDFDNRNLDSDIQNNIPTFAYSGHVYKGLRDPSQFLSFLEKLEIDFKFIVYSKSGEIFKDFKNKLGNKLEIRNYVPRDELLKELCKVDFLINIRNNSDIQAPSKLIDYYLSGRPILELTSEFAEEKSFLAFIKQDYSDAKKIPNISDYNIKTVVDKFIELYPKK